MSDYLSWQDLLEAPSAPPAAVGSAAPDWLRRQPSAAAPASGAMALLGMPEVPDEVKSALREHLALKGRMDQLTGQAQAVPEDPRTARCFPLKIHTAESRMEDRRQSLADEARSEWRRAAEVRRRLARLAEMEEQLARQRERTRLVQARRAAAEEAERLQAAREAERRTQAQVRLAAERAAMEAAAAAERAAQRERALAQWAAQRGEALARAERERDWQLAWAGRRNQAAQDVARRTRCRQRTEARALEVRMLERDADRRRVAAGDALERRRTDRELEDRLADRPTARRRDATAPPD